MSADVIDMTVWLSNDNNEKAMLVAEVKRLRDGITAYLEGDYGPTLLSAWDECPHGVLRSGVCDACIDDHFIKLLENK